MIVSLMNYSNAIKPNEHHPCWRAPAELKNETSELMKDTDEAKSDAKKKDIYENSEQTMRKRQK